MLLCVASVACSISPFPPTSVHPSIHLTLHPLPIHLPFIVKPTDMSTVSATISNGTAPQSRPTADSAPVEKVKTQNAPVASSSSADATEQQQQQPKTRKRRLGVDPSLIISEERSKRRRTPSVDPEHGDEDVKGAVEIRDPVKVKELGYVIYNRILESRDPDGEDMSQPFIKLPSKRSFPDYYETIKHPMSLEVVHNKLVASEYQTLKEVCADLGQIFNNAKRYNVKDSLLFQYAKKLHKMTRTFYSQITSPETHKDEPDSEAEPDPPSKAPSHQPGPSVPPQMTSSLTAKAEALTPGADEEADAEGEDVDVDMDAEGEVDMARPSTASVDGDESGAGGGLGKPVRKRGSYMRDGPTVYKLIKPVLRAIKEAKARDGSGREVTAMFMQLPDRKNFPDYFRTIRNPISLEEIEIKHGGRRYETWQEFFDDMELMCNNAMEYNEDFSEVYKDAQQIKDLLAMFRRDVLARLAQPQGPTPGRQRLKGSIIPSVRTPSYQRTSTYAPPSASYAHSPGPGASAYPVGPSIPSGGPSPFLPALPPGVVTEELVASLDRYPLYEQQAWVQSLPPLALQVYRQILVTNEARKQNMMAPRLPPQPQTQPQPQSQAPFQQPRTPIPQPPSSGKPVGVPSAPPRPAPPIPTIKYLDFQFSSNGNITHALSKSDLHQGIRLHNMRGVVTHCVILDSSTSEVELTAYIADQSTPIPTPATHGEANGTSNGMNGNEAPGLTPSPTTPSVTTPEISLRINGNQGSLPRFVFDGQEKERPKGMKWVLQVPTSRTETKIEVVATKPGALAETSTIFVSRQY
ncbi:hypothetical protein IAR55_004396 [Kwoniella newhampshirensis]|uniref:Bromo domain-containing protein n=1 Tax=Kwoniella newhampshirensis TaxID=1651941 RepID=A0AAW0YKR9_9TREE